MQNMMNSIVNSENDSSDMSRSSSNFPRTKRAQTNQIFQIIKIKNKKKWTKEEDTLLIKLAEKYKEKHWKEISKNFSNKNALQCFSRYKRIRPGIVKGSWSKEEDEKILHLVQIYGKSWSKISKILISRNGKQIRDRFINVLDPEIKKGKFTEEEDKILIRLYMYYGPKWATIAKHFNNRTADMIKNRFHSSIKKIFFSNTQKNFKGINAAKEKVKIF
jgi:myb proto-oncogene protein